MGTEAEQAKQLDSVTDVVQEKELDASKAQEAMSALSAQKADQSLDAGAQAVAVSKEDVALIMSEMEVTEDVAERALRSVTLPADDSSSSRLVEALRHLVTNSV
jgi:NACalpha-BTF3-like transcription factor